MKSKIKETYTKDGKKLIELIQEWMEENSSQLYCKNNHKEVKYNCR